MKTIEEEAKEFASKVAGVVVPGTVITYTIEELNSFSESDFKSGVEFAQRWIPIEEELPVCCESGNWDGLRSDYVLIKHSDGEWRKAILYSGIMDGSEYNDWYSEDGYELGNIIEWRPLNFY